MTNTTKTETNNKAPLKMVSIADIVKATSHLESKEYAMSALWYAIVEFDTSAFKSPVLAKRFLGATMFPLLTMRKDKTKYVNSPSGDAKIIGQELIDAKVSTIAELLGLDLELLKDKSSDKEERFNMFVDSVDGYLSAKKAEKLSLAESEKEEKEKALINSGLEKSVFTKLNKELTILENMVIALADNDSVLPKELQDALDAQIQHLQNQVDGVKAEPIVESHAPTQQAA